MRNINAQGLIARIRLAFLMMLALAVAGCGGGGGGGGTTTSSPGCATKWDASCGTTGSGSTGGGTTTTTTGTVVISLLDATSTPSVAKNTLTSGQPLTVEAVVKDAAGVVVPNAVVTFSTDSAYGSFEPSSGTALTSSSGVAKITLIASSLTSSGAGTVKADTTVGGTAISGAANYAVTPGQISLSDLTVTTNALGAYGSTSVYADVLINGVKATSAQTVSFSSSCATSSKAEISPSVASVNGRVTATYTDKGCAGTDTIAATIQGVTKTATVTIAAPQSSNITYVSAAPASIVLAGTGGAGLSSDSVVTFKVVDSTNNPLPSKVVLFELSTYVGGIKINNQASGPVEGTSDASGLVRVTVSAGSVPTPVWVTAKLKENEAIKSQSTNLTISTGRPTQDRFSLSVSKFNIEGWALNGSTTTISAFAFDRLGNPVPDGTVVNFISEGAGVEPSCTTNKGSCAVTFTAAELRPRSDTEPSGFGVTRGRVTVLAYAQGEESFDDLNGNNLFDAASETFRDLGDAFVDNNENRAWTSNEFNVIFDASRNTKDCNAYPSDGRYYNAPYKMAASCDGEWGRAHVRRTAVVVLSSHVIGTIAPSIFAKPTLPGCTAAYTFRLSDENNNPMPAGSTLSAFSSVTYKNDTGDIVKATVQFSPGSDVVPNSTAAGGTYHTIEVTGSKCVEAPAGSIQITVTSPSGDGSSRSIALQ